MQYAGALAVRRDFTGWARWIGALFLLTLAAAAFTGPARAAVFVDAAMADLTAEQKVAVPHPQAVQVLFEYQTKGATNKQATKLTRQWALDAIKASGLFTDVSEDPVANGAILHISINDVPMDNAAGKGFVTGLTFGLKGTLARDDYVCTAEYVGGPQAAKLTKVSHHAIYMQVGAVAAPPNGVKVKNVNEAVMTMVRQAISHALNDLAADRAFNPDAPAAAPAAPAPAPAPAAAPAPSPS